MNKKKEIILLSSFFILMMSIVFFYFNSTYTFCKSNISTIELFMDKSYGLTSPVVFINKNDQVGFDFTHANKGERINELALKFDFNDTPDFRKFRLYFEYDIDSLTIDSLVITKVNGERNYIDLNIFKKGGELNIRSDNYPEYKLVINEKNGYLESPKMYLYRSDSNKLILAFNSIFLFLFVIIFGIKKSKLLYEYKIVSIKNLSVVLVVCSIFLPHPIFNIALIISAIFLLKDFNIASFKENKLNGIMVGYFFILFINNLVFSEDFLDLRPTETYLPLLVLPIYFSLFNENKIVGYIPLSAFFIGFGLFVTSILDASIFNNIGYFSFEEFSKYTHAVHFSYLISFSIFQLFFYGKLRGFYNYLLQAILFVFLILAGSKMIIVFTTIVYAIIYINSKKKLLIVATPFILIALFPPVQERFEEIINLEDLSVVNEEFINNPNDERVNGLTLRLLLWQESINSINSFSEIIFGLGVGDSSSEKLLENINKRGLEKYNRYSTHNQFINIYMKAGLVGLTMLILILLFSFKKAILYNNKLLLITTLLFTFAMITESVLQRAIGISFFITVILLLTKTSFLNENRNNRN